jgi:prefoldin subunit 5
MKKIDYLETEIKKIKEEIKELKKIKTPINSSLIDFWENEYDERWNKY